jgi:thermospermine synthase
MSATSTTIQAVSVTTAQSGRQVPNKWLTEMLTPDLMTASSILNFYHSSQSDFQSVDVLRLGSFGRCLVLDGKIQSAADDEFVYHESLVQPAMCSHAAPKRVFIGGGGEGATAREVLRHVSVERCVMVDIDGQVMDVCKEFMSAHSDGAFDDDRLQLIVGDAGAFVENADDGTFDVIILDLADPVEGGPCYQLYTVEFYRHIAKKLAPGGILVTQSGPAGLATCHEVFLPVVKTLQSVFKHVKPYVAHVPSFLDLYGFTMVSNDVDLDAITEQHIDAALAERKLADTLRFYDGATHRHITSLTKVMRARIAAQERIITNEAPAFLT